MAHIYPFEGHWPEIHPTAFVAPTATIVGRVVIEEEASIWFGAVLRGDEPAHEIRIGARTSVQDNVVVHVSARGPTIVGPEVTLGHGAVLESCRIGRRAVVGMGAIVLQEAEVGEEALVAAGAVVGVGQRVPPRHLVAGVPAQVKRELSGEALAWVLHSADHYVDLARRYRAQGLATVVSG